MIFIQQTIGIFVICRRGAMLRRVCGISIARSEISIVERKDAHQTREIVQGSPVELNADLEHSYREMTERLAADPVGQAIVLEL